MPSSHQALHFVVVQSINMNLKSHNVPGFEKVKMNWSHCSCPQRNYSLISRQSSRHNYSKAG